MMARMNFQLEKVEACLGKTEATKLDANPEEIEAEAKHDEVRTEEVARSCNSGSYKDTS
jgi:hypothetical protein